MQGTDKRVIHDGTNHVRVNNAIRVRDQDTAPTHDDIIRVLDCEALEGDDQLFGLAFDVSKAHRRVCIHPDDWGLQACSLVDPKREPTDSDDVFLNTVGTYGIGSASYHWNRLAAILQRVTMYIAGHRGLRWLLRFADDFLGIVNGISWSYGSSMCRSSGPSRMLVCLGTAVHSSYLNPRSVR
jgi:hypothetical protein